MKSSLFFLIFLACGAALLASSACDDSIAENEAALPGVGPIGAGGAPFLGFGGSGGTAGTGGVGAGGAETGGTAGSAGSIGECKGAGKGKIRVVNLLPKTGKLEVCARAATAADFSNAKRLVRELGDAQHDGLSFAESSRGFEVDGGAWVVKVIDAAAADCSADALLEGPLCVEDKSDTSLLLLEGKLAPFPNVGPTEGNRLRFIHAYAGEGPLDVGLVDEVEGVLIPPPIFTAIGFGETSPPGTTDQGFPILPEGYIDLPKDYNASIPVGAAETGSSKALFTATFDFSTKGRTMSAFATGKKGDAAFPAKVLVCEENKDIGVLASCTQF
ncbi:MAG: hypothetical protein RMJ98_06505 [Myxococcales bacterium]|nr:hypothetical protein [Polyangiaceae bacterium]MDW8248936.1 hypothetical protein [Myxococcales bacterium]